MQKIEPEFLCLSFSGSSFIAIQSPLIKYLLGKKPGVCFAV